MEDTEIELGQLVQDEISGFTGYVTIIGDHITGCTRFGVWPAGDGEATVDRGEHEFFYEAQLEIIEEETDFTDEPTIEDTDFELGERAHDRVSGVEGIVTVINYKLWNCPQVALEVDAGEDESNIEWFDAPRLESTGGPNLIGDFEDVQNDPREAATGSVADKGPSNDKP